MLFWVEFAFAAGMASFCMSMFWESLSQSERKHLFEHLMEPFKWGR